MHVSILPLLSLAMDIVFSLEWGCLLNVIHVEDILEDK